MSIFSFRANRLVATVMLVAFAAVTQAAGKHGETGTHGHGMGAGTHGGTGTHQA